jgi:endonuclease/exonuclease/phosphatase family metal-dependent hydrolase
MEILTWNIQAGTGVDGSNDMSRIAQVIKDTGNPDIICLQEVARNFSPVDGESAEDQVNTLKTAFPDYDAFFGAAIDCMSANKTRTYFGNIILSRLPVVQRMLHQLPRPVDVENRNMPRQATEVIVSDDARLVRVMTTHLEFFSTQQRQAHASRLRELCDEAHARAKTSSAVSDTNAYGITRETGSTVLCGDFNFEPTDAEYQVLTRTTNTNPGLSDAWRAKNGTADHAPTCGIFDRKQWPQGPHCRDFLFLTADLAPRVELFEINAATDASDHQPLRVLIS